MARLNGKVLREFDANANITLRDLDDGAETADAAEAAVSLNTLTGAYWDNDEIPHGQFVVSVDVTALDRTTGDEVYDLYLEVSDDSFVSATEIARIKGVPSVGYYEVPLSSYFIEAMSPGATELRIRLDVTGTTPSLTYGAWLTYCC